MSLYRVACARVSQRVRNERLTKLSMEKNFSVFSYKEDGLQGALRRPEKSRTKPIQFRASSFLYLPAPSSRGASPRPVLVGPLANRQFHLQT
jgi:hypothetical protein